MKIHVHRHQTVSGPRWVVSRVQNGKRKRLFFSNDREAREEAGRLREQANTMGQVWLALSARERNQLVEVWCQARDKGIDLRKLVLEAAAPAPVTQEPALEDATDQLIDAKRKAGRAPAYIANLQLILGQFAAGRERMALAKITLPDIERYLDSKAIASRPTLRARLSSLFKFAVRRGWLTQNPCERLEAITLKQKPPVIFTVAEVELAIRTLQAEMPQGLPWFILTCLCGLRPMEAEKTRKEDIHPAEGWIRVEAASSKVGQRRVVYPLEPAMRLLAGSLDGGTLPISTSTRRRIEHHLRAKLGLQAWPKDVTRHTAASYWLAQCRSTAHVAESLGNSEKILRKHYKALVTQDQAQGFWTTIEGLAKPNIIALASTTKAA